MQRNAVIILALVSSNNNQTVSVILANPQAFTIPQASRAQSAPKGINEANQLALQPTPPRLT